MMENRSQIFWAGDQNIEVYTSEFPENIAVYHEPNNEDIPSALLQRVYDIIIAQQQTAVDFLLPLRDQLPYSDTRILLYGREREPDKEVVNNLNAYSFRYLLSPLRAEEFTEFVTSSLPR